MKSELPFLWVVSAKVRQVFETTKFLEKFFSPIDFHLSETLFSKHLIESLDLLDSESSYRLRKRFDQPSSPPSSNHVSDTSDHPFFGVASAKVRQLSETTKSSEKFFFRAPHSCVLYLLYIGTPSVTLTNKTCSPLIRLRHFRNPVLLSCECKGTTTFPIHQMLDEVFF